jgi:hypothetical protein
MATSPFSKIFHLFNIFQAIPAEKSGCFQNSRCHMSEGEPFG